MSAHEYYSVAPTAGQVLAISERTTATRADLKDTQAQLTNTQTELAETQAKLEERKEETRGIRTELFGIHIALKGLEAQFETLEQRLDVETLVQGLGHLQEAALRKLHEDKGATGKNTEQLDVYALIKWLSNLEPPLVEVLTDNKLEESDHALLKQLKYLEARKMGFGASWRKFAMTINKLHWGHLRNQWQRIFKYATGQTIDAVVSSTPDPNNDAYDYVVSEMIGSR
ncbi:hypothetical protein ABW21_db0204727 [Orbilia brochopaga]|nr:hypothetical protein ABW21_db0204727 [Drechslerella brochopaga]